MPDFSAAQLLDRFDEVLAEPGWLAPELCRRSERAHRTDPGLPAAARRCARRLADGLPPTVQHDDLHDGNVFSRDGGRMLIDWGDAVLAHPFGTLLVTLRCWPPSSRCDRDDPQLRRVTRRLPRGLADRRRVGGRARSTARPGPPDRRRSVRRRAGSARWASPEVAVEHDFADAVAYWLLRLADALVTERGLTTLFAMSDPVTEELLRAGRLRDSIDNMDAALVHLLAERFKITQQVGELKAAHGLPPADPDREAQQIARLRALAEDARLDPEFAEKFLTFVVAEVVRHHEAAYRSTAGAVPAADRPSSAPVGRPVRARRDGAPGARPVNRQPPRKVPSRAR